jgi:hypothetical protein
MKSGFVALERVQEFDFGLLSENLILLGVKIFALGFRLRLQILP